MISSPVKFQGIWSSEYIFILNVYVYSFLTPVTIQVMGGLLIRGGMNKDVLFIRNLLNLMKTVDWNKVN